MRTDNLIRHSFSILETIVKGIDTVKNIVQNLVCNLFLARIMDMQKVGNETP